MSYDNMKPEQIAKILADFKYKEKKVESLKKRIKIDSEEELRQEIDLLAWKVHELRAQIGSMEEEKTRARKSYYELLAEHNAMRGFIDNVKAAILFDIRYDTITDEPLLPLSIICQCLDIDSNVDIEIEDKINDEINEYLDEENNQF